MATLFRLSALAYLSPPSAAATGIRTQPVSAVARWDPSADADASAARQLDIEPLDASNARLLDAVHPRRWTDPSPPEVYDLVVIGAGAGGLVSAKQAARRGARSCLISEALARALALLRAARAVREVRRAEEFGVRLSAPPAVDFAAFESWQKHVPAVMQRLRAKRAQIAPADSHEGTNAAGADVYQGRGRFTGRNTVEVNGKVLRFRKAVIATGGRQTAALAGVTVRYNATVEREGWALECDALLVATGREPNTGGLSCGGGGGEMCEKCPPDVSRHVPVDELLATSNPDVYAAGDVVSGTPRLTHVAGEHAKVAVENALFGGAWRHTSLVVPSVIYTEPEAPRDRLQIAAKSPEE
ncbi:hypothetical protein EMIHUDRAFT_453130 [Emiliania huxleyi CCMP1516]|uniref:FAD/NAD(P)-binding domain-containing protein n=2 Tax=Emiliania huxleyi TaxID=2903 RepID=A0A0D3IAX6_EMIH1|nr:hypothetical protein EMIHUDRAFT_453130 [Emiliania huxleyi CCMP1516]EOD08411.1 hypothetical protein EMIHUDRAFT_453130 [Emiliania huxleyi CCMP1516]|eukprot:XP_005760840.1 hypothetical protein EMIHUDRAFT_453130 [Emiliania huxleyi CCMP1516]